jgi:hypothetical protein
MRAGSRDETLLLEKENAMSGIKGLPFRVLLLVFLGLAGTASAEEGTITYDPGDGAGQGKHIVLVCGDWEYRIIRLPADATVLMYGQVLAGMKPDDRPNLQKSLMPMVWTREIRRESGTVSRVVMSTIGASQDMESEDLRRLYVNSIFWAVGLESSIPEKADVRYVGGDWKASPFGGGKFLHGLKNILHRAL